MATKDVRVWTGTAWESLKGATGASGPTIVSANAGNLCKLGTDGFLLVARADLDAIFVNVAGDTMTGSLTLPDGSNTAPSLRFEDTNGTGIFHPAANQIAFVTNSAQRMTIGANGDVGIGTGSTAPAAVLDLRRSPAGAGPALIVGRLATDFTNGTGQTVAVAASTTGGVVSGVAFTHTSNNGTASTNRNVLRFADTQIRVETGANAPILIVDTVNSRVGMGSPSPTPTEALDVVGNGKFTGSVTSLSVSATTVTGLSVVVSGDTLRITNQKTIASQTATGLQGEITYDSNYIYVATGANQWRRTALANWQGTIVGPAVPDGVDVSLGAPASAQCYVASSSQDYPGRVRVTFAAVNGPTNPVLGYVVEYRPRGGAGAWTRASNNVLIQQSTYALNAVITTNDPLTTALIMLDPPAGTAYDFRVAAFSSVGVGNFREFGSNLAASQVTPWNYFPEQSINSTALGPLEFVTQTGTQDTLALSDLGKVIVNAATAADHTLIIPDEATTNFPIGSVLEIVDNSPRNTLIRAAAGVRLDYNYLLNGVHTLGGGVAATAYLNGRLCSSRLVKSGPNTWWLFGDVTPTPSAKAVDPAYVEA